VCVCVCVIQCAAERTPRFGRGIASGGERVQWWGARRWTAVYMPFSMYTMPWLGEHWACIVEEFIKNGGSPVATQRAFCICFALGRREAVPVKKMIYRWVSNFRQTGQTFGSSEGGNTIGSCCHYTWNDSQGHGQLPREAT